MLHIVNTRPADRADALTHALTQAGYTVSCLPLLELLAAPLTTTLQRQLMHIKQADIVVVVSPTAVALGLSYLQQLNIDPVNLRCQWVAVGQGTAEVLLRAGIKSIIPRIETSEGMLDLEVFQHATRSLHVMFWRGHGGRQLMLQTLQSQQHQPISINLYSRQLPSQSKLAYQQLLNQPPDVVLISSGASWQYWLELGQQYQPIMPAYILVLGERVYQLIQASLAKQLKTKVILLKDLQPARILHVLQQL